MRRTELQLDSFSSVGYGSTAQVPLNVGAIIDGIMIKTTDVDNDQIDQIRLNLSGDHIVDVTGEDLRMLDAHKGFPLANGWFYIPFADDISKSQEGNELNALVTTEKDNLTLQVKIGARKSPAQDGKTPTVTGYIIQRGRPKVNVAGVEKFIERTITPRIYADFIAAGAAGEINYKTFAPGPIIKRMHFMSSTVESLRIKGDGLELFDMSKADNNFELQRAKMVPQSDVFHFNPIKTRLVKADMFRTGLYRMVEFKPTVSAAGDIRTVFETLEAA